jgi:hypothetical protein
MFEKIPEETIEKIRERMKNGADASRVAKEFEITTTTVYTYTRDLPRKHTCIPIEQREIIREMVRQGHSKREVADLYHRSLRTIQMVTKDIPGYYGYRRTLGEEEIKLLPRLLTDGYLVSEFYISTARNLKMQFPTIIHSVRISRKTIFYVVGREKEAIKGYLNSLSTRIINHATINELCDLFGVELSTSEQNAFTHQRKLLGSFNQLPPTKQKKLEDFGSEPVFIYDIEN